jgi:hypothetical protein
MNNPMGTVEAVPIHITVIDSQTSADILAASIASLICCSSSFSSNTT